MTLPSEQIPATDYIADAITEAFGERCPEFCDACPCCEAWAQYDALKAAPQKATEAEQERCAQIADEVQTNAYQREDICEPDDQEGILAYGSVGDSAKYIASQIRGEGS